jgi:hypothetical protein
MSFASGSSNDVFFQTSFRNVACAKVLGMASSLLQIDEDSRSTSLSKEKKPSFDIYGNRINQVVFNPFMSTNDLQSMLILIRKFAQKTMILDRLNIDAKNMSSAILQFVNDIKLKRMTVKTITVSNIPMHALLLQVGLPYQAADRILALNPDIKNPNYLSGVVKIYAQ